LPCSTWLAVAACVHRGPALVTNASWRFPPGVPCLRSPPPRSVGRPACRPPWVPSPSIPLHSIPSTSHSTSHFCCFVFSFSLFAILQLFSFSFASCFLAFSPPRATNARLFFAHAFAVLSYLLMSQLVTLLLLIRAPSRRASSKRMQHLA
jgi:hypothetical protein